MRSKKGAPMGPLESPTAKGPWSYLAAEVSGGGSATPGMVSKYLGSSFSLNKLSQNHRITEW